MEIKWKEKSKFSGNMNQREIKEKLSDLGVKIRGPFRVLNVKGGEKDGIH